MKDHRQIGLNNKEIPPDKSWQTNSCQHSRMIMISGKDGVGKSFIAYNLAREYAGSGQKVLFTDFSLSEISRYRSSCATKSDLITYRPADLLKHIVPLADNLDLLSISELCEQPGFGVEWLIANSEKILETISRHYFQTIIDTRTGLSDLNLSLLQASTHCLLVSLPDASSIFDVYAMVRAGLPFLARLNTYLILNKVLEQRSGEEVHRNLDYAMYHFLSERIELLGMIPSDESDVAEPEHALSSFHPRENKAIKDQMRIFATRLSNSFAKRVPYYLL